MSFQNSSRKYVRCLPIWVLLAGFLLVVQPTYQPFGLAAYDWQRWIEALMLAFATSVCLPQGYRLCCLLTGPERCWLALLSLMMFASTALSDVGWLSWVALLRLWLWAALLVSLPVAFSYVSEGVGRKICWGVMAGLGLYAFYAGVGLFVLASHGVYDRTISVVGFANVNHAAGFLALAVMILPGVAVNVLSGSYRLKSGVALLVAAPLVMLLFIIGSRGSFLGMVAGALAVIILAKREVSVPYCKTLIGYLLSGAALYGLLRWAVRGALESPEKSLFSDSGRLQLYQLAWDGIVSAPFWGHGPLSYAAIDETLLAHPHNLLLTFLYEYGGVATFLGVLLLAALSLWVLKNRARWSGSLEAAAGMAVVVAFTVHSQVSGLAMIPLSLCVLALGVGLWGAPLVTDVRINQNFSWWALGGAVVVGGVYLVLVSLYWTGLDEGMVSSPRFWLQGKLPLGS